MIHLPQAVVLSMALALTVPSSVLATTWMVCGLIELYQETGSSQVTANGLSKAKAEMISPEHAHSARLRVRGNLYRHKSLGVCDNLETMVRDSCTSSKIIGVDSDEITCGTADVGQCQVRWALRSRAELTYNGEPVGFVDDPVKYTAIQLEFTRKKVLALREAFFKMCDGLESEGNSLAPMYQFMQRKVRPSISLFSHPGPDLELFEVWAEFEQR